MDGLILPKSPGADCQNCTLRAEAFVPPAGPAQPQLVVVGEAPGADEGRGGGALGGEAGPVLPGPLERGWEAAGGDEVRVGEPFVGKSGQLLQAMLKQVGQEWEGVWRTNEGLPHSDLI